MSGEDLLGAAGPKTVEAELATVAKPGRVRPLQRARVRLRRDRGGTTGKMLVPLRTGFFI